MSARKKTLNDFLQELEDLKTHQSNSLGQALKKPLLLLLLVAKLATDESQPNQFRFAELQDELGKLIRNFGGRPTRSGARPEQPFSHLRSSSFWSLTTQRQYATGHTVLISDLKDEGSFGSFDEATYRLLSDPLNRQTVIDFILNRWWPATLHDEIRDELGISQLPTARKQSRDPRFVAAVLDNYRHSCAFCGFHALINGQATGVDAAHIKWHALGGPDTIENGLALCKLHHWAFDKGVLGLNARFQIEITTAFSVPNDGGLRLEKLAGGASFKPRLGEPSPQFVEWHRKNIYLG